MIVSSKIACFSLLAAVLFVIVCDARTHHHHKNLTSSKSLNFQKPNISRKQFVPNPPTSSEAPESTTSSGPTTSGNPTSESTTSSDSTSSESPTTSTIAQAPHTIQQNPQIQNPSIFVYPQADIHCFIDDKLRKEVELFHVIGVRYEDSKMLISGPDENFNFHFFDTSRPTVIRVPNPTVVTTPPTSSNSTLSGTTSTTSESTSSESTTTTSTVSSTESTTSSKSTSTMMTSSESSSTTVDTVTGNSTISKIQAPPTRPPIFNTPLSKIFTNGITVAWDETGQRFHFLVPDKAYRHYQIEYQKYMDLTTYEDRSLGFRNLAFPATRSRNLTEPYTCHYNVKNLNPVCVSIKDRLVTVGIYKKSGALIENRFLLPNYLSFDKFFSYADFRGNDYILIHHRGQWIYRIDYQQYLQDQNMFFKVFQLKTPDGAYQFDDFEHADEHGLVTKYVHIRSPFQKYYRYYYSLFNDNSGLTTYCVHDKKIDGRLMILGREKIEQVKSPMEALRQYFAPQDIDEFEFPTMLRILFYCSLTYLAIFLMTQMIPNRRPLIFKDLRHTDREIQRLAPVIESIMSRVHEFLENTKDQKPGNKKSM